MAAIFLKLIVGTLETIQAINFIYNGFALNVLMLSTAWCSGEIISKNSEAYFAVSACLSLCKLFWLK